MKYFGDIPAKHLELLRELLSLEELVNDKLKDFSSLALAKGFVSISHDYYNMDMEEEGDRLIQRAENCHGGYFKKPIHIHMEKDPLFNILVHRLKDTLGYDLIKSLGFEDEPV